MGLSSSLISSDAAKTRIVNEQANTTSRVYLDDRSIRADTPNIAPRANGQFRIDEASQCFNSQRLYDSWFGTVVRYVGENRGCTHVEKKPT